MVNVSEGEEYICQSIRNAPHLGHSVSVNNCISFLRVIAPLLFSNCCSPPDPQSLQMLHLSTATMGYVGFKGYYPESALVKTRLKWLCDPSLD